MDCVKIQVEDSIDIFPFLVDAWVEDNLTDCSIATYYEDDGAIEERLYAAILNDIVISTIEILSGGEDESLGDCASSTKDA